MREELEETPIDIMAERLKRLPRRLRVVHLRALIGRQFAGSARTRQLAALLGSEVLEQATEEGGLA